MHYLLFYDFVEGYAQKREPFRAEHLRKAWAAHARGELVLAGALTEPVDTGVLMFSGDSPATAEAFARQDPYVTNGLVLRWRVRQWATVAGATAATPINPPAGS